MRTNLTRRLAAALIGPGLFLGSAGPHAAAQDTRSALCQAGAYVDALDFPPTSSSEYARHGQHILAPGRYWRVVDASDPTNLRAVGELDLLNTFREVEVFNQTAWSLNDRFFVSIDLSDPTSPREIARHDVGNRMGTMTSMRSSGGPGALDVLAVTMDLREVHLFDASDPTALQLLGFVGVPSVIHIAMADGLLYALTALDTLEVLDVSDPAHPRLVASMPLGATPRAIEVHDRTVYIGCDDPGLLVVDASDPTSPEIVGTLEAPDCRSIVRRGGTLLIESAEPGQRPQDRRSLQLLDASDPADLRPLRQYTGGGGTPLFFGQYAVVTSGVLTTLDLSDPGAGSELSVATTTRGPVARTLVASGSYLYASVTGDPPGILVVDATDPAAAEFVRDIPMDDAAGAMAADDDTLALGLPDRLELWSLADRADPRLASTLMTGDEVTAIAIDGDRLYAAVRCTGRTAIVDIADPAAPRLLGQIISPGCPEIVVASGDLLAMHTRTEREIVIFDVSNPATPVELTRYPTADVAGGMVLSGDLLYAVIQRQIDTIDLSVPSSPVRIGQSEMLTANDHLLSRRGDVLISHDRLDRRLQFWSIADPVQPVYAGAIHQPNTVGVAWVGDGAGGGEGDTLALLETTFHESVRLHDFSPCVRCPADLDGDGRLNVFDFLEFINRFNRGDPGADYDDSGDANLNDYLRYQTLFDQGCP